METRDDILLISKAKSGDKESLEKLMQRYKSLVKKISRKYFLLSQEKEDIVQEGMLGLFSAYQSFDLSQPFPFLPHAKSCIKNGIINAVKKANNSKNLPFKQFVSIDNQGKIIIKESEEQDDDDDEIGFFVQSSDLDPLQEAIFHEKLKEIDKNTSAFEKSVLTLYLEGLSYKEIAKKLGKTEKSIDSAMSNIRKKLRYLKGD